jgi:hypothetical protein
MSVGASVFTPCVNVIEAKKQFEKIADTKGWQVKVHTRIEDDKFGVRMWRIL